MMEEFSEKSLMIASYGKDLRRGKKIEFSMKRKENQWQ